MAALPRLVAGLLAAVWLATPAAPVVPVAPVVAAEVRMEALTWAELRDRIATGTRTVLLPIGGTEQNGPHMVLGKHNVRVAVLAGRIAAQLGDAVVAPVLAYVPEGGINPPQAHMRWPGTISIPESAFEAVLAGAARSWHRHGLCHIVLLGEHGGYRASLQRVAAQVNREWAGEQAREPARDSARGARPGPPCRVHAMPTYYRAATADFADWLAGQGHRAEEIGSHAGLADTALALAVDPALVRPGFATAAQPPGADTGASGDPRRATAELGRHGVEHIVAATVAAIRSATQARR